ncbi:MAG: sulfatase-like hydrolase/transferase [Planctomycetota bacterium]
MSRWIARCLAGVTAAAALAIGATAGAQQKNVVIIIADDAGWADYGFMRDADPAADPGNRGVIPTPHMDAMAASGVTFTNGYTASVCAPSRAMIVTGQYGGRFGHFTNIIGDSSPVNQASVVQGVPTEMTTIWEHMQGAGYQTATVGKWHLGAHVDGGGQLGNRPQNQGVEEFRGLISGSRQYFVGSQTGEGQLIETISDGTGGITSNAVIEASLAGQYVTDVFGDQSADYIRDKADDSEPFFLYSSFTAPHTPLQATAADLAFIDSLNDPSFTGNRRTQAAMQYAMDRNVGKILAAIDDPNGDGNNADSIAEDTLILFINDNGGDCCDSSPNASANGSLRNGKGSQFEGGMRVPIVVAGGGVDPSARGTVSDALVHAIDLVPTALQGAGGGSFAPTDVIDGVNLLPYINGQTTDVPHDDLFITRYSSQQSAIRSGKWKFLYQNGTGYQLYDLDADINESNNLINAPSLAGTVEQLHQDLAGYHVQMQKPRFDNNADDTNQFDHFRFREDAFSTAAFSTANAWTNGDTGAGQVTTTWRDGYANNELTFRAKASGSYTATNDLFSVGGFAYMVNRINLSSATAALSADHEANIDGLPVMLVNRLDGTAPRIALDATDATPNAFAFNINHDVEVYDHAEIGGNGNQAFAINGQLREFRPGRNVIKTGTSELTLGGGVAITGTLDIQAGTVALTNGRVDGSIVARTGTSLIVGGRGFNEVVESAAPAGPGIVTDNLTLHFDAALDNPGDTLWTDAASGQSLTFAASTATVPVNDPTFQAITAAYDIGNDGGAQGLNNFFESAERSVEDATFEVWFKVDNATAGGDQVLVEVGGAGRGVALSLDNDTLNFTVNGDDTATSTLSSAPLASGWHHAVGVIDLTGTRDDLANDSMTLYVNNQLVGTLNNLLIDDWAGGNQGGIGTLASSFGSNGTGQGATDYHDEIAIVRYYEDLAFSLADVQQNYASAQVGPAPTEVVPTLLNVAGSFTQETAASLALDLLSTDEHDALAIAGGATLDGQLELTALDPAMLAEGDVFTLLIAASVAGRFDSIANAAIDPSLGFAVTYDGTTVTARVSLLGDVNFDGKVDISDLTVLAQHIDTASNTWTQGDFNGDGLVNNADVQLLDENFPGSAVELVEQLSADVPEPGTTAALAAATLAALTRRAGHSRRAAA